MMNFCQEKALNLIKEQNKEYFDNIKGNKFNRICLLKFFSLKI
jgi:hypothetical protein